MSWSLIQDDVNNRNGKTCFIIRIRLQRYALKPEIMSDFIEVVFQSD